MLILKIKIKIKIKIIYFYIKKKSYHHFKHTLDPLVILILYSKREKVHFLKGRGILIHNIFFLFCKDLYAYKNKNKKLEKRKDLKWSTKLYWIINSEFC